MTEPHNGGVEIETIVEAERALRRQRVFEFGAVVAACVAAFAALGTCIWLVHLVVDCTNPGGECFEKNRQAQVDFRQELRDLIIDVGKCQTLQILEHRDANEKAHVLNAAEHGYVYSAPSGEGPPPIPEELRKACDLFLPKGGSK